MSIYVLPHGALSSLVMEAMFAFVKNTRQWSTRSFKS